MESDSGFESEAVAAGRKGGAECGEDDVDAAVEGGATNRRRSSSPPAFLTQTELLLAAGSREQLQHLQAR